MHAERNIVMANLSVCLSVTRTVSKRIDVSSNFPPSGRGTTLNFLMAIAVMKFQGELAKRGALNKRMEKLRFRQKLPLISEKARDRSMVNMDH